MRSPFQPLIEHLEDRLAPATYGNPWPDAGHLSLSFAPDGTALGNKQSELFRLLDTAAPRLEWQTAILRAFQTWAVNGNLNVSLSADGGQPLGTRGAPQGDARFGDIRLTAHRFAATDQGVDDIALGSPFDPTGGTWAGDIQLNSAYNFRLGAAPGTYDLNTVMLHEVGHALGLDHSVSPDSVMFEDYLGPRTGLSAQDIAALRDLYGVRKQDRFDAVTRNESFGTATALTSLQNLQGDLSFQAEGDLTTAGDKDFYRFNTGLNVGSLRIELSTSGLSLLTSRVTVYDSAQRAVASAVALNPTNGNLIINLPNARALSTYYVAVDSGTQDIFGIGGYTLTVKQLAGVSNLLGGLTGSLQGLTSGLLNDDLHTDDTFLTALNLQTLVQQTDNRFDQAFRGSIRDSWDVDYYRIQAPQTGQGTQVLTAMIWGLQDSTLVPRVTVYDAARQVIPAQVIVNDGGTYTLQIANARSGATYFVKAEAAQPKSASGTGNYFLGVDFGGNAVSFSPYANETLNASQWQSANALTLNKSQLFHLVVAANATVDAAVRLTIYTDAGAVVTTMVANAGDTITRDIFLPSGRYLVRYAARTRSGTPLPQFGVSVSGINLTDPIGPESQDPTEAPSDGSRGGRPPDYLWSGSQNTGLSEQDAYSDPYSYA